MRRLLAIIMALSLVTLTACGTTNSPSGGGKAPEQKAVVAVGGEANTLDPHKSFSGNVFVVTNQIYESLISRGTDGSLQPRLATEWKALDELTWEVKLRKDVTFTDGTAFNAEAVKFNLERLKSPDTKAPGAFIITMIKEIKVVDEQTVHIITDKPFAPLPSHLAHPVAAMVSPEGAKGDLGKTPIGTGPFTLKDWKAGDSITLSANEKYWGGKPKLDTLVLRVIPEAGTQFTELKAGTVDLISGLQPEKFDELSKDTQYSATKFLGWGSLFLGFNTKEGPLANVDVRKAIATALDRKGMVETLRQGMAESATALVPKTVFGAATNLKGYDYNVEEAKALMQKAGVTTPLKLTLNTYENAETKQIAGAIQAQLKEIGIDLEVVVTEFGAYSEATAKADHGLYLSSWGTVTMDADYTFYSLLHSGQHAADNKSFYANANVDKWLEEARSTAKPEERIALYDKVQAQIQDDLPYMTVYYPLSSYAKNNRLQGEAFPFAPINLDLRKAEIK